MILQNYYNSKSRILHLQYAANHLYQKSKQYFLTTQAKQKRFVNQWPHDIQFLLDMPQIIHTINTISLTAIMLEQMKIFNNIMVLHNELVTSLLSREIARRIFRSIGTRKRRREEMQQNVMCFYIMIKKYLLKNSKGKNTI